MERGPTNEQLMAEMAWVRRLARALVRDDTAAEDIAQDTWIVAAAQRPAEDRPLRPWLARVVRNLVRTRRRGDARRDERAAAPHGKADHPRVRVSRAAHPADDPGRAGRGRRGRPCHPKKKRAHGGERGNDGSPFGHESGVYALTPMARQTTRPGRNRGAPWTRL